MLQMAFDLLTGIPTLAHLIVIYLYIVFKASLDSSQISIAKCLPDLS